MRCSGRRNSAKLQTAIRAIGQDRFKARGARGAGNRFGFQAEDRILRRQILAAEAGGFQEITSDDFRGSLRIRGFNLQLKIWAPSPLCRVVAGKYRWNERCL